MTDTQLPKVSGERIARQAREQFVAHAQACLAPLVQAVNSRLAELSQSGGGARGMQERRDAMMDFDRKGSGWAQGSSRAWHKSVVPPTATARVRLDSFNLELIGDDVVERKILSGRLALAIQEKSSWELNDLRVRMQHLESLDEPADGDILRPETLSQLLVEQWSAAGLSPELWAMVQDVIVRGIAEHVLQSYHVTNEFLVSQGVVPNIEVALRVRRASAAAAQRKPEARSDDAQATGRESNFPDNASGHHQHAPPASRGQGGWNSPPGEAGPPQDARSGAAAGGYPAESGHAGDGGGAHPTGVADETRMLTSSPPLARARARATGVLGQLRRMFSERVGGFDSAARAPASPALAEAMAQQSTQVRATEVQGSTVQENVVYDNEAVQQVAGDLRRRTGELKKKASTSAEKATIEIVALMFQSILAEERIPAAVRVWFARLQMPVLRVALSEPEFFGSLEHPARQLIDRMGSCVMGFDTAAIGGSALETEIKRVVQVIEQYPETGQRVFQLVYDEFKKFLSKYLTENDSTQRLVTVAQQVEQKETLAIQYTIELRNMLTDIPVRDEIREFLFKTWAEVLAVAAVKNGPQHEETLALKASAADLVWAASAKPNRNDRAKVIKDLPRLLQRLRQGMTLVGIQDKAQESHVKVIGDTLADAFLSKTQAVDQGQIEAMAKRLANLEDFVADDPSTDLPLDAQSIEMMLGIDASMIEVVADGGSKPNAAMIGWAAELQLGNWFMLDHNGKTTQVQYAWRSNRKQLHLFATPAGRSYLIQARRLAAYLQAGLLLPAEEEALTVRATRNALAKLDANPERLLQ